MSFQLYLQAWREGEAAGIPIALIRSAFAACFTEIEEDFWQLRFGSETTDLFLQAQPSDPSLIHNLSFDRPSRDLRLWEGIWSLLGVPGTVFYFPDCSAPLVRDSRAEAAIPPSLLKALGEPVIVSTALDIFQAIERT